MSYEDYDDDYCYDEDYDVDEPYDCAEGFDRCPYGIHSHKIRLITIRLMTNTRWKRFLNKIFPWRKEKLDDLYRRVSYFAVSEICNFLCDNLSSEEG